MKKALLIGNNMKKIPWILIALIVALLTISTAGCEKTSVSSSPSSVIAGQVQYWKVLHEGGKENIGTLELNKVVAAASGTRHDISFGLD